MAFFSGFSLKGEEILFVDYSDKSDFTVSGFSLGAIKACEYAFTSKVRIDKVQLFSPAFFHDKDAKFKRLQELHFKKDKAQYCHNFLNNIAAPSSIDMQKYYHDDTSEHLHELLHYTWPAKMLQSLVDKSIMIEVFLGEKDAIIDAKKAKEFFQEFATVTWIKNAGHILKG